jgi:hypothetical protein
MALVCSPNSTSEAKPSCPAREPRDTTGKTTLMLVAVTPRLEVLAELTGDGDAPLGPVVDCVAVVEVVDDAEAPHPAVTTRTAPSTAKTPISEE